MNSHPDFPTPAMQSAARELDARIDVGLSEARGLQETMDQLAKEEADAPSAETEAEPVPLANADDLKTLVTEHTMTPEWRAVMERIDRSTLSWDEVLASLRSGTADQEITAAFQSMAAHSPSTEEEAVAMGLQPAPADLDGSVDAATDRTQRS